ncbi:MAG: molybdate ABC transporter permease subunit [Dehalococcoidia bacterium]|nr:molybdate ABC transporter permease subunit [Dehalococcoidia bacterium]
MSDYLPPIWVSLRTVLTATSITFILGILAARWLVRYSGRLKDILDGLFILPMVLPPTVVGYALLMFFGVHGPAGQFLANFGFKMVFSWWGTVVAAVIMSFPLMYMTARGAFEQVEPNLQDAARTLGASEWRVFWTVTLPMAWPGVVAGTVLALARTLGEFGATLMLAGNIPGRTTTIPVAIYFAIQSGDNHRAGVLTMVVLAFSLTSLIFIGFWKRRSKRKGMLGN